MDLCTEYRVLFSEENSLKVNLYARRYMTDHAGPKRYERNPVFQIVNRGFCNLVLQLHNPNENLCNPMINCVARCAVFQKENTTAHRATQFIYELHNFFSGYVLNFSTRLQIPEFLNRSAQFT